jgi:NAD(P)-dependent dehydrogenase (short-subunit alcohol dehydrogenase family)
VATDLQTMGLQGKVAVVTGGGAGIGFAISKGLAAAGARVVVVDVDPTRGSDALAALQTPVQECMFVAADVSAATDVDQMVARVLDAFGKIDFLVNNVGIWYRHAFWDITDDEWDRVVAVNLRGTYLCTQRVSRAMAASGGGSIVSIASQAGVSYSKGQGAHYHATKAAIIHLTRILAFELAAANIRINCVSPGGTPKVVDEPEQTAAAPLSPERAARIREQIPLGRMARPDDIAAACLFLLSDRAGYITGQNLLVNGGAIAYL